MVIDAAVDVLPEAETDGAPPPPIIWRPTPKQAEFLSASEDEVWRGRAGSGSLML